MSLNLGSQKQNSDLQKYPNKIIDNTTHNFVSFFYILFVILFAFFVDGSPASYDGNWWGIGRTVTFWSVLFVNIITGLILTNILAPLRRRIFNEVLILFIYLVIIILKFGPLSLYSNYYSNEYINYLLAGIPFLLVLLVSTFKYFFRNK